MKRLLSTVIALLAGYSLYAGISLPDKTLCYEASYHYGFINISAGDALITLDLDGDRFTGTFNGKSIPIGHRVYAISDTLIATMAEGPGLSRENVIYENGWYTKPVARHPQIDFSDPDKYKNINGEGNLNASSGTMEAVTVSTDMLALFYYFQQIDFASLLPGQKFEIAISLPDGDIQQLQIDYLGNDIFNGHETHKLIFNYSYHGVMSNYPVTAHIDKSSKLPLIFSADIKIGHIELILRTTD